MDFLGEAGQRRPPSTVRAERHATFINEIMRETVRETFIRSEQAPWETTGEGVRRQILGHGPDLMMVRVDFERGAIGTIHHHPHRQVSYVAAGSFDVTIAGERSVLSTGDCFYVEADLPHGVVAREAGTLIDVFTPTREDFVGSRE